MSAYLEIDGQPVPASKCNWIKISPCGCVSGVMRAESGDEITFTAEQALERMAGNKVAAKRLREEGSQFRLITTEAFRAMDFGKCEHDPQWGVERIDPPEGWQWATADGAWGRQTHVKHMVPVGCIPTPGEKYPTVGVRALCGKGINGWWNEVKFHPGCVSCKRCDAAAKGGSR